jgi:hypothetical protein
MSFLFPRNQGRDCVAVVEEIAQGVKDLGLSKVQDLPHFLDGFTAELKRRHMSDGDPQTIYTTRANSRNTKTRLLDEDLQGTSFGKGNLRGESHRTSASVNGVRCRHSPVTESRSHLRWTNSRG